MKMRSGEEKRAWFRCERYYHTDEGWWFQTREKTERGPFDSQHEAEMDLCLYVRRLNLYDQSAEIRTR